MKKLDFSERYLFFNNQLIENVLLESYDAAVSVYEVLKIVGGVPLFFIDHMKRLGNSLKMSNIECHPFSETIFLEQIQILCKSNNLYFGNIELRVSKLKDERTLFYLGFIPSSYPQPLEYINGVDTALFQAERVNPEAKVKFTETRLKANAFLKDKNVFEVLLVNNKGFITEGSRSNVFFIQGDCVFGTPVEYILPGVTRKYAIQAIEKQNIRLSEKLMHESELKDIDSAFISGTSLGILPIKQIDSLFFDVQNIILRNIMLEFNLIVQSYLNENS